MVSQKIREKYIALGGVAAVKLCANFREETIRVADDCGTYKNKFYGMYKCFTTVTQFIYGTPEELLFMLGVFSAKKERFSLDVWKTAKELAERETLEEIRRIWKLEGIEVVAETYDQAYDMYLKDESKIRADNYFSDFWNGRTILHECEWAVEGMS